ncbi:MAG TPA: nucleoside 2-deoxyribosyltransferase domain-containing protein [Urbifossiella sp.]|nr:nucleoside 2-deoxyribosyltransferase domain-containing protein [Urbifossiella sp.]
MTHVRPPEEFDAPDRSLFLAGGITGTRDWQAELVELLADLPLVLLNPRRENYRWDDPAAAEEQIRWEFRHLRRATAVAFWFPPETLCPIALFELGGQVRAAHQPLFVGTDPAYARRSDVDIQLRLARPEVTVADTIAALAAQVRAWAGA